MSTPAALTCRAVLGDENNRSHIRLPASHSAMNVPRTFIKGKQGRGAEELQWGWDLGFSNTSILFRGEFAGLASRMACTTLTPLGATVNMPGSPELVSIESCMVGGCVRNVLQKQ